MNKTDFKQTDASQVSLVPAMWIGFLVGFFGGSEGRPENKFSGFQKTKLYEKLYGMKLIL